MNGLSPTGELTKGMLLLQNKQNQHLLNTRFRLKRSICWVNSFWLRITMKGLYYTRVTEMLGEKFHKVS